MRRLRYMPRFAQASGHVPAGSGTGEGTGPAEGTGGAANLAESVVNSALRYRAQAPFVDTLLHEIGMSTQSINIEGLSGLSKTDYTPAKDSSGNPKTIDGK